ncbi:Abc transporter c family member 2, partial [Globisporangium polare]
MSGGAKAIGGDHYEAVPPTPKQQQEALLEVLANNKQPRLKFLDKYTQQGPLCERENPITKASLLSFLSTQWMQPLVSLGARKILEIEDLWPVAPEDSCDVLYAKFMDEYEPLRSQSQTKKTFAVSPVVVALVKTFKRDLTIVFANYIYMLALALQSYVAQAILNFLNDRENVFHVESGYVLVLMMTATSLLAVTCLNCGFFISQRLGVNLRTVIMDVIYQKSLRLSSGARQAYTTGEIVTLMSVDAERAFMCMADGPWFFVAPFGFILTIALIALLFNFWSALCGAAVIVIVMWWSLRQADQIGVLQAKLLYVVDERVKVTSEALQGIRVMKFYAWEESLARRVEKIREVEVALYRKFHVLQIVNATMLFLTPTLLSGVTLGSYVLIRGTISVTDAFTLIAMVNICRAAVNVFPRAIATISQGKIAFKRIDAYLAGEELDIHSNLTKKDRGDRDAPVGSISVRNAHFQWSASPDVVLVEADAAENQKAVSKNDEVLVDAAAVSPSQPSTSKGFCLEGVNIEIDAGELVMIVGTVGAGKSSLLNAILGEMKIAEGVMEVNGEIS